MKQRSHTNVLLVELLIALLFFMLSATVIVQVFGAASNLGRRSAIETRALAEAQNAAELLRAPGDPAARLMEQGYARSHGVFTKEYDDFTLYAEYTTGSYEAGELLTGEVSAFYRVDELLFTLPCERYEGRADE